MTKPMRVDELGDRISNICKEHREIIAAYLFGSQAGERADESSDVDIALLLEYRGVKNFPYLDFKVQLERTLNRDVDLVILNQAGEILKHQIRRYGKIVHESKPAIRKQWEIFSWRLYQDFLYLHKIYLKKFYARYKDKKWLTGK